MKSILVTGSNGLLGQHLVDALLKNNYKVTGISRGADRNSVSYSQHYQYVDLDITDGAAVRQAILSLKPELVIHAAAMTQVDQCEEDKPLCYNVNVSATRFLVDSLKEIAAKIIYLSTDFIFDGRSGPYDEQAEPNPVNYYGSTKVQAEKAVMESGLRWAIVRTVLVYGNTIAGTRSNILSWLKENLEEGRPLKVVDDQERTPTFVEDLVNGILLIIKKNEEGVFHISGAETLTPFQIGEKIADYLQHPQTLLERVNASVFRQPGERPLKTGFIIDKAKQQLGYRPASFQEALQKIYPR